MSINTVSYTHLDVYKRQKQAKEAIEAPKFDGRDIALTHKSKEILENLGIWSQFSKEEISTINKAIVNNGKNEGKMILESNLAPNLAYVVSNLSLIHI